MDSEEEYYPEDDLDSDSISDVEYERENGDDLEEIASFNENRNYLLKEKMDLLLKFNLNRPGQIVMDPEVFRMELNKINEELNNIEIAEDQLTSEIIDKEIEFVDLLEQYSSKSKKGEKLTPDEVEKVKALNYLIDTLREAYRSENKPFEPEEISHLRTWEELEQEELKMIRNVIKRFNLKIKIPDQKNFGSKEEFDRAWNIFFNKISIYLPSYEVSINPTRIGEISELVSKELDILTRVKEELKEVDKLKVRLNADELLSIDILKNIKSRLMQLDKSKLIDCIEASNVKMPANYINDLRNKKVKVIKYEQNIPTSSRQPGNIKNLLISILESLGERNLNRLSIQELENLLNLKYSIPPSLYFNKTYKYETLIEGTNPITLNYNFRTPMILVKKFPIPKDTELTNENYYQTYLPVTDSLYNKLKEEGGNVEEVWLVPYKNVLKKILKFEDYLSEIKNLILNKKDALPEENEILKYRVYQIDQYLKSGKILPDYKSSTFAKEFNRDIPGISYITKWQRKVIKQKLLNITNNNQISEKLENLIYNATGNNVSAYYSKVDDVLFILNNYPNINMNTVNLYELILFDSRRSSNVKIEVRRNMLNKIKKALSKGLSDKQRIKKYSILGDVLLNNESKRIELLLFDLADNDYTLIGTELIKFLELSSFANDLVLNKITNEQLVILVHRIKSKLNKDITDVNFSLKDTSSIRYRKFTIKELQSLVSQRLLEIRELRKERSMYQGDKTVVNNINNQIDKISYDIDKLQKAITDKKLLFSRIRSKIIKPKQVITSRKIFANIDEDLIFELIQAYKRKLITEDLKDNKLLSLLDLYDLNELSYKKNKISQSIYESINKRLTTELNKFSINQNYYFLESLQMISEKINTLPDLESLTRSFPESLSRQNVIVDQYGNDLFYLIYRTKNPFDFYNSFIIKDYSQIVKTFTSVPKEVPKVEMVLYNPATRKFGSNAFDGYLFKVYKLEKSISTGLPVTVDALTMVENPRLGIEIPTRVKYEKPGKSYFIKLPIINPNNPKDNFRWIEVPYGAVGMYPLDYDSCSRFNNENDCNLGVGIAGSKCNYKDGKCKSDYSTK
jgi:hypothetical protein